MSEGATEGLAELAEREVLGMTLLWSGADDPWGGADCRDGP
nr:hypothetical protein KPHV_11090 [Kitasatospora purpeofusca]